MRKNYVYDLGLRPADRVVVPKSGLRLVQHHALYLGRNAQGQDIIAENKIGCGVRVISAEDFFSDVIEITEVKRFRGTAAARNQVVRNALKKVGHNYDLLNYNCQHYANEMQDGIVKSPQVDNVRDILGVAALSLLCLGFLNSIIEN